MRASYPAILPRYTSRWTRLRQRSSARSGKCGAKELRLVILDSPYRLLLEPLLRYIEEIITKRQPNEMITIVVPHFIPRHWWNNLLHTQTAAMLRFALLFRPGIVITDVPYQVE